MIEQLQKLNHFNLTLHNNVVGTAFQEKKKAFHLQL